MNERIKQLLGQAYDEAVPETWTTLSSEQQGRVYEKFAELIVRECAELAREWEDDYVVEDTAPFHSDVKIKKHFGVEDGE
jgi:hypothetical protein